jgi:hypothetical protein
MGMFPYIDKGDVRRTVQSRKAENKERKKMGQIKRVTNLQKKIINQILEDGLNAYWYDTDLRNDRAIQFCVTEVDIMACVEYVEDKFKFWKV